MMMPQVRHHTAPGARRRKTPSKRDISNAHIVALRADLRDALTLLALAVRKNGGELRLTENDFDTLDPRTRIETKHDEETKELVLRIHEPKPEAPPCPTCGAEDGVPCTTKSGRKTKTHAARKPPKPAPDATPADTEGDGERAFRNPHGHEPIGEREPDRAANPSLAGYEDEEDGLEDEAHRAKGDA